VFVALGPARKVNFEGVAEGTIIDGSDEETEGEAPATRMFSPTNDRTFPLSSPAFPPPLPRSARRKAAASRPAPMVQFTPLRREGESISNVNPAMNTSSTPGIIQVMNVLDVPQAHNTLEQFALADNGYLEGIPGGMFDWSECTAGGNTS